MNIATKNMNKMNTDNNCSKYIKNNRDTKERGVKNYTKPRSR
jgi:hypothetical protein